MAKINPDQLTIWDIVPDIPDFEKYHKMTAIELRRECGAKGIKWRNATIGGHLSKQQMIEALTK